MKKGDKVNLRLITETIPGKVLAVNEARAEAHVSFIEVDGSTQTAWLPLNRITLRK